MTDIITAGILVIGDEILSGRTKDKNIGFIAEYLTNGKFNILPATPHYGPLGAQRIKHADGFCRLPLGAALQPLAKLPGHAVLCVANGTVGAWQ